MSNPCINRWGLNSFWHHYWYSDSRYAMNLQHDKIFLELIRTYLVYGSRAPSNIFWNNYWYKTGTAPSVVDLRKFYRWVTINNTTLKMVNTYRLRIVSEELFQTRVSVLKFSSWIVLNFYWFQPDKYKNKRAAKVYPRDYTHAAYDLKTSTSSLQKLRSVTNNYAFVTTSTKQHYNF
jgi:hypothetical protein